MPLNEVEVIDDAEVVEVDSVVHPQMADASYIEWAVWPARELRVRVTELINKHPGYAEEGVRALGYIDLAEGLIKELPHKTYGDYGHTA